MARIELIELLLVDLKHRNPVAYKEVMADFLADLGYGDLVEAFDDAMTHNCLPWTKLH